MQPPILQRVRPRNRPIVIDQNNHYHYRRAPVDKQEMVLPDMPGCSDVRRRLLGADEPAGRGEHQSPGSRERARGQGREGCVQEYSEVEDLKCATFGVGEVSLTLISKPKP